MWVFCKFFILFFEFFVMDIDDFILVFFEWIFVSFFLLLRFISMCGVFNEIDLCFLGFVFLVFVCFLVVMVFSFDDFCMLFYCCRWIFYVVLLLVLYLFWDVLIGEDIIIYFGFFCGWCCSFRILVFLFLMVVGV